MEEKIVRIIFNINFDYNGSERNKIRKDCSLDVVINFLVFVFFDRVIWNVVFIYWEWYVYVSESENNI